MRSLRRSASPYDTFVDSFRPFLAKRMTEMGGLLLFAGATALTVALATWSIDDPSINHATDHAAHNVLGTGGAVVSDLAMQLLGLGSLAFALPPAFWGVQLMRSRELPRGGLRITLWIIGFFAASAVASALPPTARWPLPTGLGGVAGDALIHTARLIVGAIASPATALVGFAFAAVAILCLTGACRAGAEPEEESYDQPAPSASSQRSQPSARHDGRYEEDEPSLGIVSLGTLAHLLMGGRTAIARRIAEWRADRAAAATELAYAGASPALAARRAFSDADDAPWSTHVPQDAGHQPRGDAASARREPVFEPQPVAETRPVTRRPLPEPILHDDEPDDGGEEFYAPEEPVASAPAPRSRVAPVAPSPAPAPIRRASPAPAYGAESYSHPPLDLLGEAPGLSLASQVSTEALEQNATLLEATLSDFGVRGDILAVRPGPVVTLYELEPAPGTKSSRVISLSDDIARSMSAVSARVAVVPGRNAIGIELPNARRETVYLRELLASADFVETKQSLALCLGKNIGGEPIIADLAKMPHLLVAGTTGSGKSVAINTMILSLLYRMKPEECRLIMVDPKMLELSVYDGIPHLLSPVVTDPKKAVIALKWAVREMEERYKKMS
ncbi:DNA translocase FtsK 4TM domain-containing protein, partial [Methylobacterium sp. Leaf85]|uniref:DNA translocase FtsK 4TM domain-containing protein n=1 Tax=Methylobacterium sp. Leaf85 TaxID=1736241 RepID=UPI003FCD761D